MHEKTNILWSFHESILYLKFMFIHSFIGFISFNCSALFLLNQANFESIILSSLLEKNSQISEKQISKSALLKYNYPWGDNDIVMANYNFGSTKKITKFSNLMTSSRVFVKHVTSVKRTRRPTFQYKYSFVY